MIAKLIFTFGADHYEMKRSLIPQLEKHFRLCSKVRHANRPEVKNLESRQRVFWNQE